MKFGCRESFLSINFYSSPFRPINVCILEIKFYSDLTCSDWKFGVQFYYWRYWLKLQTLIVVYQHVWISLSCKVWVMSAMAKLTTLTGPYISVNTRFSIGKPLRFLPSTGAGTFLIKKHVLLFNQLTCKLARLAVQSGNLLKYASYNHTHHHLFRKHLCSHGLHFPCL